MSEREAGTSWWAVAGSFVGIIVAAVIASFIQTALEHWVTDYFGTTMTLTLESIVVALAIIVIAKLIAHAPTRAQAPRPSPGTSAPDETTRQARPLISAQAKTAS